MKTSDIIEYIRDKYLDDNNFPLNEEAKKVLDSCFEARNSLLLLSESRDKTDILTELSYITEELALYRILSNDPGAWEVFLTQLKTNRVTARDLQGIRSIVGASYKALLKEAELEFEEEQNTTVLRGIKSFTADNGREGIILKIVYR